MSYGKRKFYMNKKYRDIVASDIRGHEARFRSQVDESGRDDCWFWTGFATQAQDGSEVPWLTTGNRGKLNCRRVMYAFENGIAPAEYRYHASCGWSLCVNPRHIELEEMKGESFVAANGREYFIAASESETSGARTHRLYA